MGNTQEDIQQLIAACETLTSLALSFQLSALSYRIKPYQGQLSAITPRQAYFMSTQTVPIEQAGDRLCGELICPYPPGIPVLMPGEVITSEVVNYLKQIVTAGGTITGCNDPRLRTIQTLK